MNNKHVCDYNLTSGSPPIQVEAGGFEDERSNKEVTTGWVVTLLLCSDDPSLISLYIHVLPKEEKEVEVSLNWGVKLKLKPPLNWPCLPLTL